MTVWPVPVVVVPRPLEECAAAKGAHRCLSCERRKQCPNGRVDCWGRRSPEAEICTGVRWNGWNQALLSWHDSRFSPEEAAEPVLVVSAGANGTGQSKQGLDLPMQRRSSLPELRRKRRR